MAMVNDLGKRIELMYTALGATIDRNPDHLDAKVWTSQDGRLRTLFYDSRDGRSDLQLEKEIQSVIHNVASLRDHAKVWLKCRGREATIVEDTIRASRALQIITDLWNTDKHKELDRPPWSGMRPQLRNIHCTTPITGRGGTGVWHTWSPATGKHSTNAPESIARVIDADVVDEQGRRVGGLHELILKAVDDWERFLLSVRY
jgi:hypothetical protein